MDDNRTTGGPIHTADGHRPLQDLHVRYEAGIDIVAIARAVITAPDRQRLLGPVDDDRHTPRPLHTTNTGIERAAVASIAAEDVDHAFQYVGSVHAFVARSEEQTAELQSPIRLSH